jgi:hypothetical protein
MSETRLKDTVTPQPHRLRRKFIADLAHHFGDLTVDRNTVIEEHVPLGCAISFRRFTNFANLSDGYDCLPGQQAGLSRQLHAERRFRICQSPMIPVAIKRKLVGSGRASDNVIFWPREMSPAQEVRSIKPQPGFVEPGKVNVNTPVNENGEVSIRFP